MPSPGWRSGQICSYPQIPRFLRAPFFTVAISLSRLGLGRLRNLKPRPPVQRYHFKPAGGMVGACRLSTLVLITIESHGWPSACRQTTRRLGRQRRRQLPLYGSRHRHTGRGQAAGGADRPEQGQRCHHPPPQRSDQGSGQLRQRSFPAEGLRHLRCSRGKGFL